MTSSRKDKSPQGRLFTKREEEVAHLMSQGMTNQEIARTLDIGVSTAKNHVDSIRGKLGVDTRAGMIVALRRLQK